MNTLVRPLQIYLGSGVALESIVNPQVSVVMVVYRTGPALFDSIATVLTNPKVDEFVVVDNGSTDEDGERLRRIADGDPRVKLFQGHGNIGFAKAANAGASAARGRWLIFLNPDAFLQPGCVAALLEAAEQQRSPCIVGARVLNADGSEQQGGRRAEVTPFTALLTFTRLTNRVPFLRRYEIHREVDEVPAEPAGVAAISGACFCVSRADFEKLGGFDGGFFLHVEDIDLCWRARRMGGSVVFQPKAEVIHLGHTSLVSPLFVEFWKGVGLARYFRKRADRPHRRVTAYLLSPMIIVVSLLRAVSHSRWR